MDNMNEGEAVRGYEERAREAGYNVSPWGMGSWFWYPEPEDHLISYSTQEEAWKACVLDNNLV